MLPNCGLQLGSCVSCVLAKNRYTEVAFLVLVCYTEKKGVAAVKSRYWAALIAGLLLVCAGLSAWLLQPGAQAQQAQIRSNGKVVTTVDLRKDQVLTIPAPNGGENVVTVKDGKIAVTAATCPDHHCMQRGFCDGGMAIVCLPNRLAISFLTGQEIDGVTG